MITRLSGPLVAFLSLIRSYDNGGYAYKNTSGSRYYDTGSGTGFYNNPKGSDEYNGQGYKTTYNQNQGTSKTTYKK